MLKRWIEWLFDERGWRFFWQRRTRGWDDSELWGLDNTIAKFVRPRLQRFRETLYSYPGDITINEWRAELDDMIYAMKVFEDDDRFDPGIDWERVDRGQTLFGERFHDLWN